MIAPQKLQKAELTELQVIAWKDKKQKHSMFAQQMKPCQFVGYTEQELDGVAHDRDSHHCPVISKEKSNKIMIEGILHKDQLKLVMDDSSIEQRVDLINELRSVLHEYSPFKNEPIDFVRWVANTEVTANDYNPNKVAPPEMKLLEISITNDGYTQPIVSWNDGSKIEVIDGFHRHRVGKESEVVSERVKGYLPIVDIRKTQSSKNDRIASTIRHNRARGKHQIDAMSEIVLELKNRNWRNSRIARELGMDEEEVLRLCQISGLEHLFSDNDFSKAWISEDVAGDWEDLTDDTEGVEVRIANANDPNRFFHTYEKWECHKAGFYASGVEGMKADECIEAYRSFLANDARFTETLKHVISEWKFSCEHYLTNTAMNRIAWLGQAAMCYATGIPSKFCAGFNLLTEEQKEQANITALNALNEWLEGNSLDTVDMDTALSIGRQIEIY